MLQFKYMSEDQTHSRGGRPSKYKEEFPEKLLQFFEDYLREPNTKECIEEITKYYKDGGEKEVIKKYKVIPKGVPTLFGFARSIGVDYHTVNRWQKERIGEAPEAGQKDTRPLRYPEFCQAYKLAQHFQTEYLIRVGIGGTAPSAFAIFTAKNMIGWRDKNELGFTDDKGKPVSGGFVILPKRLTPEEAQKEYEEQSGEDSG